MKHLLWYLLAGTRGGDMRARILLLLRSRPKNAHKLSQALSVDYSTVQHHMRILCEHHVCFAKGGYGAVYFISPEVIDIWDDFGEIWERIGKMNKKGGN